MITTEVKIVDADHIEELELGLFPENCFNALTLKKEISIGMGFVSYDENHALAGYLLGRWDWDHQLLDIIRIGVAPKHQGKGVATNLLKRVFADTDVEVMLMARKDNRGALRLYHKFGFEIVAQTERSWVLISLHGRATKG